MLTTPSIREREIVGAFLIDIGPQYGALRILRGFEPWVHGSEVSLKTVRSIRNQVEKEAACLWFGFVSFCEKTLRRDPEAVLRAHFEPADDMLDLLRSLTPDRLGAEKVRDELVEIWLRDVDCVEA